MVFEFDHRQIAWPTGAGLPDDMQPDATESRIGVVAVLAPAGGEDIHLDVTLERLGSHLDECPPEIRPGLEVEEAGMEDGRFGKFVDDAKWPVITARAARWILHEKPAVAPACAILRKEWSRNRILCFARLIFKPTKNAWPQRLFGVFSLSHFEP